jgi:RNA polymerase sigma-70 factor (ECF subfamily)
LVRKQAIAALPWLWHSPTDSPKRERIGPHRTGRIIAKSISMVLDESTFEEIVSMSYESLYRFAFSLTEREADARDLTQEAFSQLAKKAAQIQDKAKIKSWLFTTLYRAFIDSRRRQIRYPHVDVDAAVQELPASLPVAANRIDAEAARQALTKVDEVYRTPLTLFYLGEHSYLEIAEILKIPPGTVMSRISRGRTILRRLLGEEINVVPLETIKTQAAS